MVSDNKIAELARYCRIDGDLSADDKQDLSDFYDDAIGYLAGAGIPMPTEGVDSWAASYMRCVKMMVLDAWDRRRCLVDSASVKENPAFRQRINQMKMICLVPNSGTRQES